MSTRRTGRMLVATSGSVASKCAITYAAREAASRGLPLELVHVITPTFAAGPYGATAEPDLRLAGREVLARGGELARATAPDIAVRTTLLTGSRADAVVHHADRVDLLVVGAPPHDLMGRFWTGSTVMGIAARASCPVVVIPERAPRQPTHEVLVGVKSSRHSQHLLATAFAVARQTQSDLRILHAWQDVSPYDEAVMEHPSTPEWERKELRTIEGVLIDLRMAYPEVQVRVALVRGRSADTLLSAAANADLVVISRPTHGGFLHHLGSTARALIRQSVCPVMVVPPLDAGTASEHRDAATATALVP